jgi:NAD-dependent dihydropyrimidine dehydrogenase PreA subunit
MEIDDPMFIVTVDIEKCEGCSDCVDNCPSDTLTIVEEDGRKYAVFSGDPDDCIGCLSCEGVCPEGAITVTEM